MAGSLPEKSVLPRCPKCGSRIGPETWPDAAMRGADRPGWRCTNIACRLPVLEFDSRTMTEEAEEAIRDAVLGTEETDKPALETESCVRVVDLWPQVKRALNALGHPEAMVTDESRVSDFADFGGGGGVTPRGLARAAKSRLGVRVRAQDRVVDVAQRLAAKDGTGALN